MSGNEQGTSNELTALRAPGAGVDELIATALAELRVESARSEAKAATLLTVTGFR